MAETTTITIRLPVELKAKLDRLAEVTQRSRSFLAVEALERYAQIELEIVDSILEGIADADAGRVISHEEAMARLDSVLADAAPSRRTA